MDMIESRDQVLQTFRDLVRDFEAENRIMEIPIEDRPNVYLQLSLFPGCCTAETRPGVLRSNRKLVKLQGYGRK